MTRRAEHVPPPVGDVPTRRTVLEALIAQGDAAQLCCSCTAAGHVCS
ncbi:hypothetical protein [Amycolatopsis pithecellobii]|uniref:Uncharacterized protein n=1 Tax=Amycolatopsis pithecellobii TaxID=664692 RepID=A0A6N7Z907_9PSEU|nr:hypothetical protein [Amycolatopsis pithecellobii]MTD57636.1 hypothetical protein [Amycolatopsis pithecellobii]